jgi:hypothetical protein
MALEWLVGNPYPTTEDAALSGVMRNHSMHQAPTFTQTPRHLRAGDPSPLARQAAGGEAMNEQVYFWLPDLLGLCGWLVMAGIGIGLAISEIRWRHENRESKN